MGREEGGCVFVNWVWFVIYLCQSLLVIWETREEGESDEVAEGYPRPTNRLTELNDEGREEGICKSAMVGMRVQASFTVSLWGSDLCKISTLRNVISFSSSV